MKKIVLTIAALLSVGMLDARLFRSNTNRNVCRTACPTSCPTACPTACPAPASEPCPPKCCKTIQVPQTIMVDKVIEVPARKIVIPQPDQIEYIAQAPIEVRTPQPPIPQPDVITYKCVPDVIKRHPQPPCIRYECPADCQ